MYFGVTERIYEETLETFENRLEHISIPEPPSNSASFPSRDHKDCIEKP